VNPVCRPGPTLAPSILIAILVPAIVAPVGRPSSLPSSADSKSALTQSASVRENASASDVACVLNEVVAIEQLCLSGTRFDAPQKVPPHLERLKRFLPKLDAALAQVGLLDDKAPSGWDGEHWVGQRRWLRVVRGCSAPNADSGTNLLNAIYARAIIRLATLSPTPCDRGIGMNREEGFGMFYRVPTKSDRLSSAQLSFVNASEKDRLRAMWELRFFNVSAEIVSSVSPSVKKLLIEGRARLRFVSESETDQEKPLRRRALGWAYGMCGRPMNAHYLDDAVAKGKCPKPAGWTLRADASRLVAQAGLTTVR